MKLRFGLLLGALALAVAAPAQMIDIQRNSVLEATSDQELSLRNNREGDRVSISIYDNELPRGTKVYGEIARIEQADRDRPGYMDVVFNSMILPNGQRYDLHAVPVPLNSKELKRDRDGRFVADPKKAAKPETAVLGGVVGGLIVGALIKKPFEGAFLGALAGILIAESEKHDSRQSQHIVLKKGAKLGAMLETDLRVDMRNDRFDRDRVAQADTRDRDRYNGKNGRDGDADYRGERRPESMSIRYGNREVQLNQNRMPYREGKHIFVPLSMATQMGLDLDRRGDRIYIDGRESSVRLELGSKEYRLNGKKGELEQPIAEYLGEVYIPIAFLAAISEKPITVDGREVNH